MWCTEHGGTAHSFLTHLPQHCWLTNQAADWRQEDHRQTSCLHRGRREVTPMLGWKLCWSCDDESSTRRPRGQHTNGHASVSVNGNYTVTFHHSSHTCTYSTLSLLHYSIKLLNQWNCCRLDVGSMGTIWTIYMYNDAAFNAPNIDAGLQCIYVKFLLSRTSSIYWQWQC